MMGNLTKPRNGMTLIRSADMSWNVFLGRKLIDRVWFLAICDAEYVRDSLINHDGYHPAIRVVKG